MLTLSSWLHLAERLAEGRSARVNHDCGEGRTLSVSNDSGKLRAWCHRCNDGATHTIEEALSVRVARLATLHKAEASLTASLPEPRVRAVLEWPPAAVLWFLKAGLGTHDIGKLGAYYHPPTQRVVLPVPGFWQARAVMPGQQPKYMAPNVDKGKVLPRFGTADTITLTEDILSAYKVGQVGEGWCLMGTNLSPNTLMELIKAKKPVNVYLDNDLPPLHQLNRGQIAAAKVMKTLRAVGIQCRNIVTDRDPKLTTYEELRTLL